MAKTLQAGIRDQLKERQVALQRKTSLEKDGRQGGADLDG